MFRRCVVFVFMVCISGLAFGQRPLPSNADHLRGLEQDEAGLIAAAWDFHLQQLDLIDWDIELMMDASDKKEAERHQSSITLREASIQEVWEFVMGKYPRNPRAMNYFGEYWYDTGGNQAQALTYWNQVVLLEPKIGRTHNNLGIHYFHTGDYRRGLRSIEEAVDLEPKNPDFLFNIAQMYLIHFPAIVKLKGTTKKKLYREAMNYSRKAAQNAPDDMSLAQDYAVNFYASDNFGVEANWDTAAEAWQVVFGLADKETDQFFAKLNEARCWIRGNDWDKAVPALNYSLAIIPGNDVAERLLKAALVEQSAKKSKKK